MGAIAEAAGKRIGDARRSAGMTQAELARAMTSRLGRTIQPLTVTRIEGAKRPLLLDELVAIAAALCVNVDALIPESAWI